MTRNLDDTQPALATAVLAPGGSNVIYWEWAGKYSVRMARFILYGVDRDEQFIAALTIPHGCSPFVRWADSMHFQYGYVLPSGAEVVMTNRLPPLTARTPQRPAAQPGDASAPA